MFRSLNTVCGVSDIKFPMFGVTIETTNQDCPVKYVTNKPVSS